MSLTFVGPRATGEGSGGILGTYLPIGTYSSGFRGYISPTKYCIQPDSLANVEERIRTRSTETHGGWHTSTVLFLSPRAIVAIKPLSVLNGHTTESIHQIQQTPVFNLTHPRVPKGLGCCRPSCPPVLLDPFEHACYAAFALHGPIWQFPVTDRLILCRPCHLASNCSFMLVRNKRSQHRQKHPTGQQDESRPPSSWTPPPPFSATLLVPSEATALVQPTSTSAALFQPTCRETV